MKTILQAITLALSVAIAGCASGNVATHRALNTATDVIDPSWEMAIVTCESVAMVVIERGTEAAAVRERLAQVTGRCDALFAAFETIRELQLTGRAAADAGERRNGLAIAARLIALHREVRDLVAAIRQEIHR